MEPAQYSGYWCHLGEFTHGPQPCGCGGPADCPNMVKHTAMAIKSMGAFPIFNPAPYSVSDFRAFWLRGGLVN